MEIFIYMLMVTFFLVCAVAFILPVLQAKKSNLITEGTIISIRCERRRINKYGKYGIYYFPTFKFSVDGKEYIKESGSATSERKYKEGQKIKVAYYKENPMDAIILTDKKAKVIMGIGLTIFILLVGFSVLLGVLGGGTSLHRSPFSPSYILLVIGIIVLIICCFISKK